MDWDALSDIRREIEAREARELSPFAARAADSVGRAVAESPDPVRTAFQRDRDRILHSKAFRRLKHKTQVFIDPAGDHYRTRLTHTLEVAQIARTIGRALRLNEDLIEAIALGHDLGHAPFGHAGESALDAAIRERADPEITGFRHFEQSLRIVETLEPMNLTDEVRRGIDGHSKGRNDLTAYDGEPMSTLEAAVVRISDRVAYLNHDIDDALRSGIIARIPPEFAALGDTHSARVKTMVYEVIRESRGTNAIRIRPEMLATLNALKEWLFTDVYHEYPVRFPDIRKAQAAVRELFLHFAEADTLPAGFTGVRGAVDYVAGMTDRFAMDQWCQLRVPSVWDIR
ncbi:MAG: deoxyguanosinetriphosphate triphosphohydrolase [Fimbriimonadaceae bacterium]|nr:deoxyguanosinetriphosphate triphosphohydrolase [Fimbriimonadaceae bacterium]